MYTVLLEAYDECTYTILTLHMHFVTLTTDDYPRYDTWVNGHSQGSFWQSPQRMKLLQSSGLKVSIECVTDEAGTILASALIQKDQGKLGAVWEIARGPLWNDAGAAEELIQSIIKQAKEANVIAIYCSPLAPLPCGGWKPSGRHIHPEATRVIDLTKSEEELLAAMHQKGRYNIKVAEKAGVVVRQGSIEDIDSFYSLLTETKNRDGFTISQKSHYSGFIESLSESFFLIAEHEKKPIAGLIGVVWNGVGVYYYGSSSYADRALMAPYLLQWEAMKYCKAHNCHTYDLLGVDPPLPTIGTPRQLKLTWHGISDFKRKFGGSVLTYPQEQVLVLRPIQKMLVDLKRKLLG